MSCPRNGEACFEYYCGGNQDGFCASGGETKSSMTIEALEKQIPKKPDFEGDGYADGEIVYDTWICPCCGTHYEVEIDDYKHCPECGQAIDWSVE